MLPDLLRVILTAVEWIVQRFRQSLTSTDPTEIRKLLDSGAELRSCAPIHRRLHRHLDMQHSFVSVSDDPSSYHHLFDAITTMVRNLSPSENWEGWEQWVTAIEGCTERYLPEHSMSFRTYIQSVAFTSVLIGFLGATLDELDPQDVTVVTTLLDELCAPGPARPEQFDRVHGILRQWLHERYENALDFIMPAYETIWSVVASTVAMVYDDDAYKSAFLDFGENPTPRQFEAPKQGGRMPSAEAVVMEVLRLHPPNRQMYVETPLISWPFTVSVVRTADVGAAQRSAAWGDDANVFNPHREGLTQGQQSEERPMLAFGHGRLKCVEARWAPIAAGIIIGKTLESLDKVQWRLEGDAGASLSDGLRGLTIHRCL